MAVRNVMIAALASAAALFQVGCSTHTFHVKYEPAAEPVPAASPAPQVAVGNFRDDRGTVPTWLGAIRGGYGNPLKKLHSDQPMDAVVAKAIADALQARQLLASADSASVRIEGSIAKLDCSYYFNREAHAHLLLNVFDKKTNAKLFSQTYKTDATESGVGAGIFGNVQHLADFMQKTLNQTIDKALADPALMTALSNRPAPTERPIADRLDELDASRRKGLISDAEYAAKRTEILSGL